MLTTLPKRSNRSTEQNFSRYMLASAAVGAVSAATAARADFSSPYELTPPPPGNYSGANVNQTFGAWTGATDNLNSTQPFIDTSGAPSSLSLGDTFNFDNFLRSENLNFTTTIQGNGNLQFNWNFTSTNGSQFGYTLDNVFTSLASSNAASTTTVPVTAGDVFGFRVITTYRGSSSVAISNFAAPVPEPGVAALAATGALGLIALRALRRARAAKA